MDKEIVLIVGNKIRELRKAKGLSQDVFANEVGLSPSYYYYLEHGRKSASIETLVKIALSLDVEVGCLFPSIKELKTINNN